jgi:hypothetical protein
MSARMRRWIARRGVVVGVAIGRLAVGRRGAAGGSCSPRSPAAIGSRPPGRSSPSSVAWCQKVAVPGRARFRLRYDGLSSTAITDAASRAATAGSRMATTSVTGATAAPRPCPISPCSVVGTIAPSTRRATRSSDSLTALCGFCVRPDGYSRRSRTLPGCPVIRRRPGAA